MKDKISRLLDEIYELEGLLHLALNREVVDSHLADLILRKNRQTLADAEKLFGEEKTVKTKKEESPTIQDQEKETQHETYSEKESESTSIEERPEDTEEELKETGGNQADVTEEEVPVKTYSDTEEDTGEDTEPVIVIEAKELEPPKEKRALIVESMEYSLEDEDIIPVETSTASKSEKKEHEEPVVSTEPVMEQKRSSQTSSSPKSKPSYSINDRFLFIRELFDGDAAAFNKAMEDVAAMDSFEEAESYFTDERGFDEDSDTAVRFFEILLAYFKKR